MEIEKIRMQIIMALIDSANKSEVDVKIEQILLEAHKIELYITGADTPNTPFPAS